jgi:hypothetical protein
MEAVRVQLRRGGRIYRRGREVPAVRGDKPREAEHVARSERLYDDRSRPRHMRTEFNLACVDKPASIGWLFLLEYRDT